MPREIKQLSYDPHVGELNQLSALNEKRVASIG